MIITYEFVDGTKVEVNVDERIGKEIQIMNTYEESRERTIRRHEVHLNPYEDHGDWGAVEYDLESESERDSQSASLNSLSDKQLDLVNSIYCYHPMTIKEYADREGVSSAAICSRLNTIRNNLKKF